MKLKDLLRDWQPPKPKKGKKDKLPDPWFFSLGPWYGMAGAGMGEAPEQMEALETHRLEDMPKRIHLGKSFFMELEPNAPWPTYIVRQLLDEQKYARVIVFPSPNRPEDASWIFSPGIHLFPDADEQTIYVSPNQLYNYSKLKAWATNQLVMLGLIPPIGK